MDTFGQWIHQHNFLLVVGGVVLSSLVLLSWFRLWTKQVVMVWGGLFIVVIILLLKLRTPSAMVSEVVINRVDGEAIGFETSATPLPLTDIALDFSSVAEIEAYLQEGDKPTLIEFYADYGIS